MAANNGFIVEGNKLFQQAAAADKARNLEEAKRCYTKGTLFEPEFRIFQQFCRNWALHARNKKRNQPEKKGRLHKADDGIF